MGNEKIEAMIRHLERFDTGGRTGVQGELVTDCETCGIYDEPCSGCRIRSGEEVRAMMAALRWTLKQTPPAPTQVDDDVPDYDPGPEIDVEGGMSEAEVNRED